jgi:hypothetical protein
MLKTLALFAAAFAVADARKYNTTSKRLRGVVNVHLVPVRTEKGKRSGAGYSTSLTKFHDDISFTTAMITLILIVHCFLSIALFQIIIAYPR